jgi:chromosome segregation ATPase
MTTKQVHAIYDLIQEVFKREGKSSQALHRLVSLADDQRPADWQDCHGVYPQVTTTTSSSSVPTPPSTPQPTGFDYKKSLLEGEKSTTLRMYMDAVEKANKLQSEVKSLKEVIGSQDGKIASLKESVENRTKTIEMLKNQIELLTNRIKDDREHWDGCREHNNELVAANAEIYESLRHWGLEQSEPCSLVNNVKQVIQLCAERGKKIADLSERYNQLEKRAEQRAGEAKMRSDMIDIMEKQADQKDRSIESLNADCSRLALEIKQKDKVISALNDRITQSGEAMTMLGVDNKKLNEALETLSSVNQKIADNVAKLRHEKDSDEASYIKKLADKSLRIAVLKKVGNELCACLKRYHYSDTQQPHVVSALRNWEKEAR